MGGVAPDKYFISQVTVDDTALPNSTSTGGNGTSTGGNGVHHQSIIIGQITQ